MKYIILSLAFICSASITQDSFAKTDLVSGYSIGEIVEHGGRTNSSGCHNDTKQGTYHCH